MIHNEGIAIIALTLISSVILYFALSYILPHNWMRWFLFIIILTFNFLVLWFFRNPDRNIVESNSTEILAPADGKLVAIENMVEEEYFNREVTKLSIFMSPLNVHVNRVPMNGRVSYQKYHPGKYLVAWHPKSSTLNERNTVVIENKYGEILLRQIAGAVARRIVCYTEIGRDVKQGEDLGFIKFGSRVDVFIPTHLVPKVSIGDKIVGNRTVLARWND